MYNSLAVATHTCIKSVPVPLLALLNTFMSLNQYFTQHMGTSIGQI